MVLWTFPPFLKRDCFLSEGSTASLYPGFSIAENTDAHSLVLVRLDYCTSIIYGLPECTLRPLKVSLTIRAL